MTTTIELAAKCGFESIGIDPMECYTEQLETFRALCVAERDRELIGVGMEPIGWMERQMLLTGWSDWYARTPRRNNDPTEMTVDQIQFQFSPVYAATQLAAARLQEREYWHKYILTNFGLECE